MTKTMNQSELGHDRKSLFRNACLKPCRRIAAQIRKARNILFAEARASLKVRDHMLRLALNEAEALAWQTLYPHLFFPVLATEKVQEVFAWNRHQQQIATQRRPLLF